MFKPLAIVICLVLFFVQGNPAFSNSETEFQKYILKWEEKRELASKTLIEAEEAFKASDELTGCVAQQKAGEYGVAATEALIMAMKVNGSTDGLENLEAGLNKWKELRDIC